MPDPALPTLTSEELADDRRWMSTATELPHCYISMHRDRVGRLIDQAEAYLTLRREVETLRDRWKHEALSIEKGAPILRTCVRDLSAVLAALQHAPHATAANPKE